MDGIGALGAALTPGKAPAIVPDTANETPFITPLPSFGPIDAAADESASAAATGAVSGVDGKSFSDTLKGYLGDVNDKMTASDKNVRDLASGKMNDPQAVVQSVEEANLAFQFTMALRTKVLEAYQEVSRMQV